MKKKSLFKILQNISVTLIFIVTAIFICAVTGLIKLTPFLVDALGLTIILCLGFIFSLPWIKYIEQKKYKIASIIFLVLIIICSILWAICLIIIVNVISKDLTLENFSLILVKSSALISIQFLIASTFASIILKYKKSMIPFQVITYASYIFIDVYFSILIFNLGRDISFNSIADLLFSKVMLTFLFIAFAFVCISNAVIKRTDKRRINEMVDNQDNNINNENSNKVDDKSTKTTNEKLQELKQLYESELITKEEYEKKKAEILDNM